MTAALARVAAVVALLSAAAAVATPPGRLPLALRGLSRLLAPGRKPDDVRPVSLARRAAALALVVVALLLACWRM